MAESKQHFWRGDIRSQGHAVKVVNAVAYTLLTIAGLALMSALTSLPRDMGTRRMAGDLIVPLIFGLSGAFLWKSKSQGAAIAAVIVAGLPFVLAIIAGLGIMASGMTGFGIGVLVSSVVWFALLFGALRGLTAARRLRELNYVSPHIVR